MRIEQSLPAATRSFRVCKGDTSAVKVLTKLNNDRVKVTGLRKWDLSRYTGDPRDANYIVVSTQRRIVE